MQNRKFKNICWLGSQRKVKCKCNLDSSIDSPAEGWNVLIFWWKWKINILTIPRSNFSIFYWLEISKKFLFSWNTQIKFKNFKVFGKMLFFILVLKNYHHFLIFILMSSSLSLVEIYLNSCMQPQFFPWFFKCQNPLQWKISLHHHLCPVSWALHSNGID